LDAQLDDFSLTPQTASWFRSSFREPTAAQRDAWPLIRGGDNVLLSAPTGTGKTLAAFLPLLDRLPTPLPDGLVGLVIMPLKALVHDQLGNVTRVVEALAPELRIALRTGDTEASIRRRQKKSPPHALWTTPESLAILLTHDDFRRQVKSLRWVVVDEIHALAGNKRGSDLSLSLERLEAIAGALQRIGLSATCEPLDDIARFLVGADRPCRVVRVPHSPNFELTVEPLPTPTGLRPGFIARVVDRVLPVLAENRTTLLFANTRNVCERLGYALKKRLPHLAIATHHGSLARERRREIEGQLKAGELKAVVSSSTLELGIDIGTIDAVVLVNPPGGVARFLQRIGRSGHRPDLPRRGLLLTSHPQEVLEAAVTARSGRLGMIEPIAISPAPLDVLCQHLVGMGYGDVWSRDDAFALVRRAYPYRDLSADDFDDCLRYLHGKKRDGSDWLPGRLEVHEGRFTICSRRTARLVRRNLGTIVAEEPRPVRLEGVDGKRFIGELDDQYADRLQPGDRFLLDGRCLTLRQHGDRELIAIESSGFPWVPRWGNSGLRIPEELARRIYDVRFAAARVLRDVGQVFLPADALAGRNAFPTWIAFCRGRLRLGEQAGMELARYLEAQDTVSEVSSPTDLLIEVVDRGFGVEYALHTPLHSAGNEALALVLSQRLVDRFGGKVTNAAVTLGLVLFHETDSPLGEEAWRQLLDPTDFESELNTALRFGHPVRGRFLTVAQIGLMVLRQPLGGRRKVGGRAWIERRLFDQVAQVDPDFVLLRQARREAREQTCDVAAATRFLVECRQRLLKVRPLTEPSPFAAAWLEAGEEAAHLQFQETL
jgi:ATP-dependent Lhr-like helicase